MKIPFNWLKDYVSVGALKPEDVAERLTLAGLEVVLIEKIGGDAVFDIEITPNRPDCLSIIGVAREASACLEKPLKTPKIRPVKEKLKEKPAVDIKDKKLCPRYTARVIRGVKIGPSPKWLKDNLEKMGVRPVNNIVDITNFCLFELGQPMHAFDYDKLRGGITVRRARKGEKITTIDRKEKTLSPDMLVIADDEKAIALAGIMGSKDTEVTEDTKNILLESAYFDPVSIRRASRGLGLISESSYRFERSVDIGGVVAASNRACGLIKELCGIEAEFGVLSDAGAKDPKGVKIYLRPERLKKILGFDIAAPAIKRILSSLGLSVEMSGREAMAVFVPSFRQDLKTETDLVEEVIRIYGYDRMPSTMPVVVGHPKRMEPSREALNIIRDSLVSLGLDEVITYSLISKDDLRPFGDPDGKDAVVIKNPLSIEQEIMRMSMLPGILHAVSWNINRSVKDFGIFELGRLYFKKEKTYIEKETLAIALVGEKNRGWRGKARLTFFELKSVLETLFERLGIPAVSFKNEGFPPFLTGEAACVEIAGRHAGFLGEADRALLDKFGVDIAVLLCELSLENILGKVEFDKKYRELPRFPSAKRDLSIIIKKDISHERIVSTIKDAGGGLVASVELSDQYFGAQIPQGARGLGYSIEYRADDRTLTDEEVGGLHAGICDALSQKLGATIR